MDFFLDKPKTKLAHLGYHGTMQLINVAHRLQKVRERIAMAESRANRPAGSVELIDCQQDQARRRHRIGDCRWATKIMEKITRKKR